MLTEEERNILNRAARNAIVCGLHDKELPVYGALPRSLQETCGAFVTLYKNGKLRGCIGYIDAVKPLIQTIQEIAVKAAFDDPRFSPLTEDEFHQVRIEISVLTPLEPVSDVSTIEIGKHGLVVEYTHRRGLLLPQVATEYGWDCETFLSNTAMKAGLPPDAWKHPSVKIYKFSAEVFGQSLHSSHEEEVQ